MIKNSGFLIHKSKSLEGGVLIAKKDSGKFNISLSIKTPNILHLRIGQKKELEITKLLNGYKKKNQPID